MVYHPVTEWGGGDLTLLSLVDSEESVIARPVAERGQLVLQAEQFAFQIQGEFGHRLGRLFALAGLEIGPEQVVEADHFRPDSTQTFHAVVTACG